MSILKDLVIFEMANSHQGDIQHGIKIIKEMGRIARKHHIKCAVKLQYRDIDTFIHPDFKDKKDVPHISRFTSTKLNRDEFNRLVDEIKAEGLIAMSTPFDEKSVDLCIEQNLDIIKIASCSALDWPLLEKVAKSNKPIIISTGGLSIADVDKIYSFLTHRSCEFAMLHCIAIYPAPMNLLHLDIIKKMKQRYPNIVIGYSGHEDPDNVIIPAMAIAEGAEIMERHVGLPTETIKLNLYSMSPEQADVWVNAIVNAKKACSFCNDRKVSLEETDSLRSLQRGVYARNDIDKGKEITKDDVFFAMPLQKNQLTSGEFKIGQVASKNYRRLEPISEKSEKSGVQILREYLHEAKGMLNESGIIFGNEFAVEISHHYGVDNFRDVGCIIVNIMNREYCKKLIIVLPGQKHPIHYHLKKEESFQVLYGDLNLDLNGERKSLNVGEVVTVKRGDKHGFSSCKGAIFEEISTTHYRNDSFYEDPQIAKQDPMLRKTFLEGW